MKAHAEQILDLSARMGILLMENGGEVYRAEDTMQRICSSSGEIERVDALAIPGWLILTVKTGGESFTMMRRVNPSRNDLYRVTRVNDVSRRFVAKQISIDEAHSELDTLLLRTPKQKNLQFLGGMLAPMCITLLGRASFLDAICAGIAAACLLITDRLLERQDMFPFMRTFLDSLVGAFVALLFYRVGIVQNIAMVLIGSIMLQFPGIMMASAVRDSLSGDIMTGQSEMMQAIATALALGLGVGFMLLLFGGDL